MIRLGLTGSIAMGKSTTAGLFARLGVAVYSADAQVHKIYTQEPALSKIEAAFPGSVNQGKVDRQILSRFIAKDPNLLKKLEAIVHPLLQVQEQAFLQNCGREQRKMVVLDIPLLYETGAQTRVDYVAVVSASLTLQRERALAREGMDERKFSLMLARQMPDEEKRRRADFIIDTRHNLDTTLAMVRSLCRFFHLQGL